jgi:hypothetical protein
MGPESFDSGSCAWGSPRVSSRTSGGTINFSEQGSAGVRYLALGIGLLTGTSLFAQVTGSVPPSGVLTAPPPAPVAVPPSGVLATGEGRHVSAPEFKAPQKLQPSGRATAVAKHRYVVHRRSAARRETTTRAMTTDQSIAATPSVLKATPEQSRPDATGYEIFLHQFGKGKE